MITLEWIEFGMTARSCVLLRATRQVSEEQLFDVPRDLAHRAVGGELRVVRDGEAYYASLGLVGLRLVAVRTEDTLMALRDGLYNRLIEVRHHLDQATHGLRRSGFPKVEISLAPAHLIGNGPLTGSGMGYGSWKDADLMRKWCRAWHSPVRDRGFPTSRESMSRSASAFPR